MHRVRGRVGLGSGLGLGVGLGSGVSGKGVRHISVPAAALAHATVLGMPWCVSKSHTNLAHDLPMVVVKAAW